MTPSASPFRRRRLPCPSRGIRARSRAQLYEGWVKAGYFKADASSGNPPYSIVLPPPNVTGNLHMGHALDHTLMDALTRRKRMQGYEVLWLPGMDHAGIATQTVVEKQLAVDGKTKEDFGRELFIDKVWDWKHDSGGTIAAQMRRLGDGVDWSRDRFTMDDGLSRAVRTIFKRLFDAGLIYRAERLVNWSPVLETAISDLEVKYEDVEGELVSFRYGSLRDDEPHIVVATTRVETMLGDTAIAVHPDDERYRHLVGKTLPHPFVDRELIIVADEHVDPEFGTGAVKVTPAHDPNDFEIGLRHQLPMPSMLDTKARITDTGTEFDGLDRFEARIKVREALAEQGRIVEEKRPYLHSVGHSERSGEVIEPRLSMQWWVKVESLAKAAGDAVRNGDTVIHPPSLEPRWFAWVDNMHDWCISRQLWWGHRIPIWHGPKGETVCVGPDETPAGGLGAGLRRARHVVLIGAVAVLDPGLARPHRRPGEVLSDHGVGDRVRHPVLLGGPNDDVRYVRRRRSRHHARRQARSAGAVRECVPARADSRRVRPQDEQVARQRYRPAGLGGAVRRRRTALHPGPRRQPGRRPVHRRGPRPRVAELRHQAVQRHPVRAHERGGDEPSGEERKPSRPSHPTI